MIRPNDASLLIQNGFFVYSCVLVCRVGEMIMSHSNLVGFVQHQELHLILDQLHSEIESVINMFIDHHCEQNWIQSEI